MLNSGVMGSMRNSLKPWEIYEQAARAVVFDLRKHLAIADVEDKQDILRASGMAWEIDGKAALADDAGFLVIEARRHTASVKKGGYCCTCLPN